VTVAVIKIRQAWPIPDKKDKMTQGVALRLVLVREAYTVPVEKP